MKLDKITIVMALLNATLSTLHLAGDISFGLEPARGLSIPIALAVAAIWLYATVALAGRRLGYLLLILGSLFSTLMPVIHMSGRGVGMDIAGSSGGFLFVWTLLALGVAGPFSFILSVHGLWRLVFIRK